MKSKIITMKEVADSPGMRLDAEYHLYKDAPIECPRCKGTDFQICEFVYRRWRPSCIEREGITLKIDSGSDEVVWESSANAYVVDGGKQEDVHHDVAAYCTGCDNSFPLPEWVELEWL